MGALTWTVRQGLRGKVKLAVKRCGREREHREGERAGGLVCGSDEGSR